MKRHSAYNFPSRQREEEASKTGPRFAWAERLYADGEVNEVSGVVEAQFAYSSGHNEQIQARRIVRDRIKKLLDEETAGAIDAERLMFRIDITGGSGIRTTSMRLDDTVYILCEEIKERTIERGADGDILYTLYARRGNDFVATVLGDWTVQRVKEEEQ